jgi:hypothetical protein
MARTKHRDEVLTEIGFRPEKIPGTACRVFCMVTGAQLSEETPGWLAVAEFATAMFAGGVNDNAMVSFAAFAEMLRKAFARVEAPDRQLMPFDQLRPVVRAAWEAVARHLTNVFNFEREDVNRLGSHEKRMAEFARRGFRN